MNKNELIDKLNLIAECYDESCAVRERIKSIVPEDNYQRNVVVPEFPDVDGNLTSKHLLKSTIEHKSEDVIKSAKLAYKSVCPLPKEPRAQEKETFKKPSKPVLLTTFSSLTIVGVIISLFFFAGSIFSLGSISPETLWTIPVIIALGLFFAFLSAIFLMAFFVVLIINTIKVRHAQAKFNEEQKSKEEMYKEQLSQYQEELDAYKEKEQAFLNKYLAWREVYLEHLDEEARISAQLEIDKKALMNEMEERELAPVLAKLNEVNDLTSEEYLPVVGKLASFIQSGRADNLKEAINLYEENLYKERQLQLEREKEERRQYEELLRLAAEQSRHEEQMRLLQEQEAQRQAEERYRRQEEERRHREEMELLEKQESNRQAEARREEARRQHDESIAMYRERNATQRQCNSCANVGRCRVAFQRANCASFVPK